MRTRDIAKLMLVAGIAAFVQILVGNRSHGIVNIPVILSLGITLGGSFRGGIFVAFVSGFLSDMFRMSGLGVASTALLVGVGVVLLVEGTGVVDNFFIRVVVVAVVCVLVRIICSVGLEILGLSGSRIVWSGVVFDTIATLLFASWFSRINERGGEKISV